MERRKNLKTHTNNEDKEIFWKEHLERQKESGLSGMEYCKKNQLHYRQFRYWSAKTSPKVRIPQLLPVTIETTERAIVNRQSTLLGTVIFKKGHELKIHDKSLLPILFSLLSES